MTPQDNTVDRYAVMGNPIAHSKSPEIHALFARQTGQLLSYEAILVETDQFTQSLDRFMRSGGKGLNITVPFKQQAWEQSDQRSQRAQLAGAVNTLSFKNGQLMGDNTDGIGLARDLGNRGIKVNNQRILLAGAGGAVRGVLLPILEQNPTQVIIANRTQSKAQELASLFSEYGNISALGYNELPLEPFDLIINGTAASLQGDLPPIPDKCVNNTSTLYDMMYASEPTSFLKWGKQRGAKNCIDGLGMLVEQAAESFYIWRGIQPETKSVITALREQMT